MQSTQITSRKFIRNNFKINIYNDLKIMKNIDTVERIMYGQNRKINKITKIKVTKQIGTLERKSKIIKIQLDSKANFNR